MSERVSTAPKLERLDDAEIDENNIIDAELVEESSGGPESTSSGTTSPETPPVAEAPEQTHTGTDAVPYTVITPLPQEESPRQIAGQTQPTRLTFATVDQSADVFNAARDEADRRLDRELAGKGIIRKIWKGNILKDFYRNRYTEEAKQQIEKNGDINMYETGDKAARRAAQMATIDRMTSEYEESLHASVGERRNEMEDKLADEVKRLIRQNVDPVPPESKIDDATLQNELMRTLDLYSEANKGENQGVLGEGKVRVNNMLEITQAVKGAIAHGESLDTVLENMRFVTADARSGVRTEAQHTKLDSVTNKIIEKMGKRKWTAALVSPEVIVSATSLTYSVMKWGTNSVLGNIAKVIPVVGAGLLSGARESVRVTNERAQHTREMAQGKQFDSIDESQLGRIRRNLYKLSGGNRREQMEKARYETKTATSLVDMLNGSVYGTEADLSSNEAVQAALNALAEVESRIRITDSPNKKDRVDLISYSSSTGIEEERLALDIARAQAKTTLDARLDLATRKALELDESASITELLDRPIEVANKAIESDMSEKDRAFLKLKAKRVATSAAMGIAGGLLVGGLIQEGIASFSSSRAGLIEELWNADNHTTDGSAVHETLYKSFGNGDINPFNGGSIIHHEPSGRYLDNPIGEKGGGNVSVSDDLAWEKATDGSYSIKGHDGAVLADHLTVQADGHLDPHSIDTLKHTAGIDFQDDTYTGVSNEVPTTSHTTGSLHDYMASDKNNEVHVFHHDPWEDNKTKAFDKNERGFRWGGEGGKGVTAEGGYQFDISKMTAGGSSNTEGSVNWQEAAANGNLKMAITPDAKNAEAVFVDVKPDGKIDVQPGSKAAAFFSTDAKGHAVFHGKYAEVVRVNGTNTDGSVHGNVLATVVGDGSAAGKTYDVETQVKPAAHEIPTYRINSLGYDTPTEVDLPVVPVIPRRSLETVQTPITGESGEARGPITPLRPGEERTAITTGRTGERVLTRSDEPRRRTILAGRRQLEGGSDTRLPRRRQSRPYSNRGLGRESLRPDSTSLQAERIRRPGPPRQIASQSHESQVAAEAETLVENLSRRLNATGSTRINANEGERRARKLFGPKGFSMRSTLQDGKVVWRVTVNEQGIKRLLERRQREALAATS